MPLAGRRGAVYLIPAGGPPVESTPRTFSLDPVLPQTLDSCHARICATALLFAIAAGSPALAQTAHFAGYQAPLGLVATPRGIAVDALGNVYVADAGYAPYPVAVYKETPSGDGYVQTTIVSGLTNVTGIAVDKNGVVYVAAPGNNGSTCGGCAAQILMETPTAAGGYTQTVALSLGASSEPEGIAVDSSGNLYIADVGYQEVFKETLAAGKYTQTVVASSAANGLDTSIGVAVDGKGNVFIADAGNARVLKETPSANGYAQTTAVSIGSANVHPGWIALDANDDLFIVTTGTPSTFKETLSGETYTESTVPTDGLNFPQGIAVDGSGNVFIADSYGSRVVRETLSPSGGDFGAANVNSSSPQIVSLFFKFDTAGKIGSPAVLAEGVAGLDFANYGSVNASPVCTAGTTYSAGAVCPVDVAFTPTFAGFRPGAVVLRDSAGNPIATGFVKGTGIGPQLNFLPAVQSVIENDSGDRFGLPYWVAVDGAGSVYIVNPYENYVFKETLSGGAYTGSPIVNFGDIGGVGGVAVDGAGQIYIAYLYGATCEVIRETPAPVPGGYAQTTIPTAGNCESISGIAVDGSGDIFLADGTEQVEKLTPTASGYTPSVIATGLNIPCGIAVDGSGNVFIADSSNQRVLMETPTATGYTQSVLASGLIFPYGVAVDAMGNVYFSDEDFHIYKLTLSGGKYTQSLVSIDGQISAAGIAVDAGGNLYYTDELSFSVYKKDYADPPTVTFDKTAYGSTSADSPRAVSVENIGNAALTFPIPASGNNPSVAANFTLNSNAPSACPLVTSSASAAGMLAAGDSCRLSVSFAPETVGNISGSLILTDNALYGEDPSQTISLSGVAVKANQTIAFAAIPAQVALTTLGLSATASSALAVTFASTTSSFCTVSGATASFIASGTCTIQAAQAGNGDYLAATASQSFTVSHAAQSLSFTPVASGQVALNTVNLAATDSSGQPATFSSLTLSVCTVKGSTASLIASGACTLEALAPENDVYSAATVTQAFAVLHASQTITFATVASQTAATTLKLTATASSSLTVSFASSTPTVCTVSGATASLIAAGSCTIEATQSGNDVYSPASTVSQTFSVSHASQTITFAPIAKQTAATTLNLKATASSGLAVSYSSSTPGVCTISDSAASLIAAGSCTIQASQPGNSEYSPAAPVSRTFTVALASQTIFFELPLTELASTTLLIPASDTSGLPLSFASSTPRVCTVSGNTASFISYGRCTITASQAGNDEFAPAASVTQTVGVAHALQAIHFTPIPAGQVAATTVGLAARATSGLPVSFSSLTPSVCAVKGATASLVAYGRCTILGSVAGNNEYFAASSEIQFGVGHAHQTIGFPAIASQTVGTKLALSATASSGLAVSFASNTPTVCTVTGSAASMIAAGTCTIEATQAGNDEYFAASPVTRSFTVAQ
jgi:sugar lactone lactonase YvrE